MKYKYLLLCGLLSFIACNNDEPIQKEDFNDLVFSGLKGNIKTRTTNYYRYVVMENNEVKATGLIDQHVDNYDTAGFLTKTVNNSAVVTSISWSKNREDDILVVSGIDAKPVWEQTYTLDDKNRIIEKVTKEADYETHVGDFYLNVHSDTVSYAFLQLFFDVQIGDPLFLTVTEFFEKEIITYDDIHRTATAITYISEDGNTYEEERKIIFKLNEYGRIDKDSEYEEYKVLKSFEDIPSVEKVVKRDEKGNIIEMYTIRYGDKIQIQNYVSYSYIYY